LGGGAGGRGSASCPLTRCGGGCVWEGDGEREMQGWEEGMEGGRSCMCVHVYVRVLVSAAYVSARGGACVCGGCGDVFL
jgi:hypothetical protein